MTTVACNMLYELRTICVAGTVEELLERCSATYYSFELFKIACLNSNIPIMRHFMSLISHKTHHHLRLLSRNCFSEKIYKPLELLLDNQYSSLISHINHLPHLCGLGETFLCELFIMNVDLRINMLTKCAIKAFKNEHYHILGMLFSKYGFQLNSLIKQFWREIFQYDDVERLHDMYIELRHIHVQYCVDLAKEFRATECFNYVIDANPRICTEMPDIAIYLLENKMFPLAEKCINLSIDCDRVNRAYYIIKHECFDQMNLKLHICKSISAFNLQRMVGTCIVSRYDKSLKIILDFVRDNNVVSKLNINKLWLLACKNLNSFAMKQLFDHCFFPDEETLQECTNELNYKCEKTLFFLINMFPYIVKTINLDVVDSNLKSLCIKLLDQQKHDNKILETYLNIPIYQIYELLEKTRTDPRLPIFIDLRCMVPPGFA